MEFYGDVSADVEHNHRYGGNFESYRPEIYHEEAFKKDGFVQPYCDSPLDGETVGEHVYLNIISQAKKYLYILPRI